LTINLSKTTGKQMQRESMQFDVVIVGAGPAGLSAALRLKQLASEDGRELSVCLLEKGAEIGAHSLSGAVIDTRALSELLPDWASRGAPLNTPVSENRFLILGETRSHRIPEALLPACFRNQGHHLLSLGELCRWLGQQAEQLGVEIYPGFAGAEVLYDDSGAVTGVATGDQGVLKDGTPGPAFQRGMALHARYTFFAEGCRGQLGKQLEEKFGLRAGRDPQVYGLGIKELWQLPPAQHQRGLAIHTGGWPLSANTYGGGFMYHLADNRVALGLVTGLGYSNPYLSPFEEFQRFKLHPALRAFLENGQRIAYGARALTAGGLQSLPKLTFPGGVLIGDNAGFLNAARTKGIHGAIKSGALAAEACFSALTAGRKQDALTAYPEAFRHSWLHAELHETRNFKPWMSKGVYFGGLMFGIEQTLLGGKAPWTLHHRGADHARLKTAAASQPVVYAKADGKISFDRLSSVYLSDTHHDENQPCHLKLETPSAAISVNLARYDAPEQRYCPAGVYEIVRDAAQGEPRLQINAQNCLHCKACDIKDPGQNITWLAPQGGEGPNYQGM
jgi:electron-transferring-flavoprotein dehydrogenase